MDSIQQERARRFRSLPPEQAAFVYWRVTEDPQNRLTQEQMPAKILELTGRAISVHFINNWKLWTTLGEGYSKEKKSKRYENLIREFTDTIRVCEIKPEHFKTWPDGPRWDKLLPNLRRLDPTPSMDELPPPPPPARPAPPPPSPIVRPSEHPELHTPYVPRTYPPITKPTDYSKVQVWIGDGKETKEPKVRPAYRPLTNKDFIIGFIVVIIALSLAPTICNLGSTYNTNIANGTPVFHALDATPTFGPELPTISGYKRTVNVDIGLNITGWCISHGYDKGLVRLSGQYTCWGMGRQMTQAENNDFCDAWRNKTVGYPDSEYVSFGKYLQENNPDSFFCSYN